MITIPTVLFDLTTRGHVEVTGPDAAAFLHNLCTNDIKNLAPGRGCEFFLTTNKAKVVAHGWVHRLLPEKPATLLLDVDPGGNGKVTAHLNHFIVSEQVEVTDRTGSMGHLHLCGTLARQVLEVKLGEILPDWQDLQHDMRSFGGQTLLICRHDLLGQAGYDLLLPATSVGELSAQLQSSGALPQGPDIFEVLRIEAGVPLDGVDMDAERFVVEVGRIPQAISYNKGCYLGQEPIVMARDRGHANRTLLRVQIDGTQPLERGTVLLRQGQEVGQVTSSAWSPRLEAVAALAYVKRGNQQPGTELEGAGRKATIQTPSIPA